MSSPEVIRNCVDKGGVLYLAGDAAAFGLRAKDFVLLNITYMRNRLLQDPAGAGMHAAKPAALTINLAISTGQKLVNINPDQFSELVPLAEEERYAWVMGQMLRGEIR